VVLEKDGEDQLHLSMKNEEVLHRVKLERNILLAIKDVMLTGLGTSCTVPSKTHY